MSSEDADAPIAADSAKQRTKSIPPRIRKMSGSTQHAPAHPSPPPSREELFYARAPYFTALLLTAFALIDAPIDGSSAKLTEWIMGFPRTLMNSPEDLFEKLGWRRLVMVLQLFALFLLPHLVRSLTALLWWGMALLVLPLLTIFLLHELPIIRDIDQHHFFIRPRVVLPDTILLAISLLPSILPVVVALLVSNRMRRPIIFVATWLATLLLVVWLGGLWEPISKVGYREAASILALLAIPVLCLIPPGRPALAACAEGSPSPQHQLTLFFAGAFAFLWLGSAVATDQYYQYMLRQWNGQGTTAWRPAGAVKAGEALAQAFDADSQHAKGAARFRELLSVPRAEDVSREELLAAMAEGEALFAPQIAALREALDADYIRIPVRSGPPISARSLMRPDTWIIVPGTGYSRPFTQRETARFIQLTVVALLQDGRVDEALEEAKFLYQVAALLNRNDAGILVDHMLAAAIRGMASESLRDCWHAIRSDELRAKELATWIDQNRHLTHVLFPIDTLEKTGTELAPITFTSVATATYNRAIMIFHRHWAEADLLRIGLALDTYHRASGAYPESTDQLVPDYLSRLPVDPLFGKPYSYQTTEGGFILNFSYRHPGETHQVFLYQATLEVDSPPEFKE